MLSINYKKDFLILSGIIIRQFYAVADLHSQTEILKWKDGKSIRLSKTLTKT